MLSIPTHDHLDIMPEPTEPPIHFVKNRQLTDLGSFHTFSKPVSLCILTYKKKFKDRIESLLETSAMSPTSASRDSNRGAVVSKYTFVP